MGACVQQGGSVVRPTCSCSPTLAAALPALVDTPTYAIPPTAPAKDPVVQRVERSEWRARRSIEADS
jgi:hypothetical protein